MPLVDSMLAVLVLAALHIFCVRLRVIRQEEHSPWLSFAGGVAVAYVFMVLLPKLSDWQGPRRDSGRSFWGLWDILCFGLAYIGLFNSNYGLPAARGRLG